MTRTALDVLLNRSPRRKGKPRRRGTTTSKSTRPASPVAVKRKWIEGARWGCLAAAVLVLIVFLVAQRQSIDGSYGNSPSSSGYMEGDADELSDYSVPSDKELVELVGANPVTRLPGSIAYWDEQRVRDAIGDEDVRIIVAPPGLDKEERLRVKDVKGFDHLITVVGTEVGSNLAGVVPDRLSEWRGPFATGDVTDLMIAIILHNLHKGDPPPTQPIGVREPTPAELEPVAADLRANGVHVAEGATLTDVPAESAGQAFPDGALFAVFPQQEAGRPLPDYGAALTKEFPGKPIVVMFGNWIEYHGPQAEDFADVAAGSFYGQFAERLSRYDYPQRNILGTYLARVTDLRYAGVFDRPVPDQPFDPVRVALPALPWIFAVCGVVFLVLSARQVGTPPPVRAGGRRLAGLTALAIEVSGLSHDPALTRAIASLQSAREMHRKKLPDRHVSALLDEAAGELDQVAKSLGRPEYRPDNYLVGRLA